MNKNLKDIVNTIIEDDSKRTAAIAKAEEEIRAAKETLRKAREDRRKIVKGNYVDWKKYAENMAALLNELPEGAMFTPTQLAHIYSLSYPEDKNVGVLHIYPIADTHGLLDSIDVKVKGLIDCGRNGRTKYCRRGKAEVICR